MRKKRARYTIVSKQGADGCTTVRAHPRNKTYHIIDYGNEETREQLNDLPKGSIVTLELSPANHGSNVWCVESVSTPED